MGAGPSFEKEFRETQDEMNKVKAENLENELRRAKEEKEKLEEIYRIQAEKDRIQAENHEKELQRAQQEREQLQRENNRVQAKARKMQSEKDKIKTKNHTNELRRAKEEKEKLEEIYRIQAEKDRIQAENHEKELQRAQQERKQLQRENDRVQAEKERVKAENHANELRRAKEEKKKLEEIYRIQAEKDKVQAENHERELQRAQQEREQLQRENDRVQAEKERVKAENHANELRRAKEEKEKLEEIYRIQAEKDRIQAENHEKELQRAQQEREQLQAEKDRVQAEKERIQAENHEKELRDMKENKEKELRSAEEEKKRLQETHRIQEELLKLQEKVRRDEERKKMEELAKRIEEKAKKRVEQEVWLREEAERNLKDGVPEVIYPTGEEHQEARKRLEYQEGCLHVAITGASGSGKSSLINAIRGYPNSGSDKDANIANSGTSETTGEIKRYLDPDPSRQWLAWYDVPGAGTLAVPAWQYFNDQCLYIFNIIIIVIDIRFTRIDVDILFNCKRFGIPTFVVRSKANQHIQNIMNDDGGDDGNGDDTKEERLVKARDKFVTGTRNEFMSLLENVGLPQQKVYIVCKDILRALINSKSPKAIIDEVELVNDVIHAASERRKSLPQ